MIKKGEVMMGVSENTPVGKVARVVAGVVAVGGVAAAGIILDIVAAGAGATTVAGLAALGGNLADFLGGTV